MAFLEENNLREKASKVEATNIRSDIPSLLPWTVVIRTSPGEMWKVTTLVCENQDVGITESHLGS